MKTTKKLIALVLGAMMLLGILAGCGNAGSQPATTSGTQNSVLSGMLVFSAEASFKISYDQDGMVMEITADNDAASALLEGYDYNGKSCSIAVKELIAATAEATLLRDSKNVVLKLATGSQLPSETFLDGIAKDAADAVAENGCTTPVVAIGLDGLDADGYINAEYAQTLLKNYLGVTAFDSYDGDTVPLNGSYTIYAKSGDVAGSYLIDAVTGLINETVIDETEGESEHIEEDQFDVSFEEELEEPADEESDQELPEEDPAV